MLQVATQALPPSQIVYRQLLNMRSALRNQGHDPIMADHVMRAEVTRYLADRALESAEGPDWERAVAFATFDSHLAARGRPITPEAEIRKFEHDTALAVEDGRGDRDAMAFWHGLMVAVAADLVIAAIATLLWWAW